MFCRPRSAPTRPTVGWLCGVHETRPASGHVGSPGPVLPFSLGWQGHLALVAALLSARADYWPPQSGDTTPGGMIRATSASIRA